MNTVHLTAEQKIRQTLTGDPDREPSFEHEGAHVIRWLTGGTLPDAWVTFHLEGEQITVKCAMCQAILGHLPADHDRDRSAKALGDIRLSGHKH